MPIIEISDFKGVVNSGDLEDIPQEFLTVCKNMRPYQGRLRKTFGFGVKLDSALANAANSFGTFVSTAGVGYYIVVYVNSSSKVATFYAWTGSAWAAIATTFANFTGTYYHRAGTNPIFQESGIFRMLPGNVGYAVSTNEGKGVWLGYIDRDFFDGLYLASTYTQGYFNYDTNILAPTFVPVLSSIAGGIFNSAGTGLTGLYRLSYVYDGIQESLLSDNIYSWAYDQNTTLKMAFILTTSHNKRITAIKVYRALYNPVTNTTSPYYNVHTIDLLRKTTDVFKGVQNAYNAKDFIHVPGAISTTFDAVDDYRILLNGKSYHLLEVGGSGQYYKLYGDVTADFVGVTAFTVERCTVSGGANNGVKTITTINVSGGNTNILVNETCYDETPASAVLFRGEFHDIVNPGAGTGKEIFTLTGVPAITEDWWDVEWEIWERTGTFVPVAQGDSGAFCGPKTVAIDPLLNGTIDFTPGIFAGGILIFDSILYYVLTNTKYMIHLGVAVAAVTDKAWTLMSPAKGMYDVTFSSPNASYTFYDTYLTNGAVHPLIGEISIKINGEFARIIGGRLWQGNIVLDPGGKNEVHEDWCSYSELNQYDVNPASNVMTVPDREGGAVTGIAELYGCPVIMKKQGLFFIYTKGAPATPTSWSVQESAHNIGNIAKLGYIEVAGSLYVVWHDGIYRLNVNNLAASDSTPTEKLRITDAIEDMYRALTATEKESIQSVYDKNTSEIIFSWKRSGVVSAVADAGTGHLTVTSTAHGLKADDWILIVVSGYTTGLKLVHTGVTADTFIVNGTYSATGTGTWESRFTWPFNIITNQWRQIKTVNFPDIYAYDENSDVMVYTDYDKKVYGSTVNENADFLITTKTFSISDLRAEVLRAIWLTYKAGSNLTMSLYTENSDMAKTTTYSFAAATVAITKKISPKIRVKKFRIEISQGNSATYSADIDALKIEHD